MKWIGTLSALFNAGDMQELNTAEILIAFEDPTVRKLWLHMIYEEIRTINQEVDRRLRTNAYQDNADLSFRRQGLQFALESIRTARRQARGHNPLASGTFDHESVTVQPV